MENTVQISLAEYEGLSRIKSDFDKELKSELKRLNDGDRAFVLRDRDEYVRRNEILLKEKTEAQEEVRRVSEANVKLRLERDSLFKDLVKARALRAIRESALETAESEIRKRIENEATLHETVNRLREERRELLLERDALLGRGLFSRILNRRP